MARKAKNPEYPGVKAAEHERSRNSCHVDDEPKCCPQYCDNEFVYSEWEYYRTPDGKRRRDDNPYLSYLASNNID